MKGARNPDPLLLEWSRLRDRLKHLSLDYVEQLAVDDVHRARATAALMSATAAQLAAITPPMALLQVHAF